MYKPGLIEMLKADHADASRKYMEARETNAAEAEHYLCRMKLIAKNIKYTQQMIDGTLGKHHMSARA